MAYIQERISSKGEKTFRVQVRRKGYPTQTATFPSKTKAMNWAKSVEAAMHEKRYFKSTEAQKHTLTDMIDRYLKRIKQDNRKRHDDIKSMLDWWKEELGHCILADLTKSMITEKIEVLSARKFKYKNGTEKPISPARVNRYIAALSHACTIAVNEWDWLEHHPLDKISRKKEPRGRVRFLDDEERGRLLDACKQSNSRFLYTVVILALSTGARQGEILKLRWKDVDMDRGVITLHDTKNKERRTLPVRGLAMQVMQEHQKVRRIDTDLVFPAGDGKKPIDIRESWLNALEKAKIEDFRFHDLRHTAASYLAMNGASLAEIAEVLGHKTLAMVKRYAHLSESHTHSVVADMNNKIFGENQSRQ